MSAMTATSSLKNSAFNPPKPIAVIGSSRVGKPALETLSDKNGLAPFREKIKELREHTIILAQDLVANWEKLEKARSVEKVKLIGLLIKVTLAALIVVAALGGTALAIFNLLSSFAPFISVELCLALSATFEYTLIYFSIDKIFSLIAWIHATGRKTIHKKLKIQELEQNLHKKLQAWNLYFPDSKMPKEVLEQVKSVKSYQILLERLKEPRMLEWATVSFIEKVKLKTPFQWIENSQFTLSLLEQSSVPLEVEIVMPMLPRIVADCDPSND